MRAPCGTARWGGSGFRRDGRRRLLAQQLAAVNPNTSADQGPGEDGDHEQSDGRQLDIVRVVLFDDIGTS